MKKTLILCASVFMIALTVSINFSSQDNQISLNEAFAHDGECVDQHGGFCYNGTNYVNNAYYKKCKCVEEVSIMQ